MKRLLISLTVLLAALPMAAQSTVQGWPANYGGVMLQAFSWDDFDSSQWTVLEKQADEFAPYFSLVWIPQSGNCDQKSWATTTFTGSPAATTTRVLLERRISYVHSSTPIRRKALA